MDPIEASLRRTLEGGDSSDPHFRQSIYAASERAIERMIEQRGLDEDRAHAERVRLAEVMDRVESEYGAQNPADEGVGWERGVGASVARAEEFGEPHHPHGEEHEMRRAPAAFEAPAGGVNEDAGEQWTPRAARGPAAQAGLPRRRRRLVLLIAGAFALALLVFAAMAVLAPDGSDGAAPGQTGSLQPEAADGGADLAWISIFSGNELGQISSPGGGRVAGVTEADRSAVRLSAAEGANEGDGEILIGIGPALIGELAGSDIRVELVAGSPDDTPREFSVRCLFGEASVCERQRFGTAMREEAFVFDTTVPADASSPARLAIGPGISADGRDIDIYSVRLRVLG